MHPGLEFGYKSGVATDGPGGCQYCLAGGVAVDKGIYQSPAALDADDLAHRGDGQSRGVDRPGDVGLILRDLRRDPLPVELDDLSLSPAVDLRLPPRGEALSQRGHAFTHPASAKFRESPPNRSSG